MNETRAITANELGLVDWITCFESHFGDFMIQCKIQENDDREDDYKLIRTEGLMW